MLNRRKTLVALLSASAAPSIAKAQTFIPIELDPGGFLAPKVAAVEAAVEQARAKHNVPGAALVVVKDDKVILARGFGKRTLDGEPVTVDTLFGIGSASKSFVAMATMMSVDDKKLSLDDPPSKHIPYFKLADAEANAQVTMRDLLIHSSGLMRTELVWTSGVLSREDVVRAVGEAKPTAKFRSAWQYQNVMYIAAGEAVASAQGKSLDAVLADRIFAPLGMSASTTLDLMDKERDISLGHTLNKDKKPKAVTRPNRHNVLAAGGIVSNVRDMAQWVRVMLGGGVLEGKRLISDEAYQEIIKPQISMGGDQYGLGWMVGKRDGIATVYHGGNLDGFETLMFLVPEHKLGFALLTNVFMSPLVSDVRSAVWANLVATKPAEAPVMALDSQKEAGHYITAGLAIDVEHKDDGLVVNIPDTPELPLIPVKDRRYKIGDPAPEGFFVTFRPVKALETASEMLLEVPAGQVVLAKQSADDVKNYTGPYRDLIAKYAIGDDPAEITAAGGRLILMMKQRDPLTLVEQAKDVLTLVEAGMGQRLTVSRDQSGAVAGFVIKRRTGDLEAKIVAPAVAEIDITTDQLLAKMIAAAGGEANLNKPRMMRQVDVTVLENQGVQIENDIRVLGPQEKETRTRFTAIGKSLGNAVRTVVGATVTAKSDIAEFSPDYEADTFFFDFREQLEWAKRFKSVTISGQDKVGDEPVYVVAKQPNTGLPITDYVSKSSFLVVRRKSTIDGAGGRLDFVEDFSEHRSVDGIVLPMRVSSTNAVFGKAIAQVKSLTFDGDAGAQTVAATAAAMREWSGPTESRTIAVNQSLQRILPRRAMGD